MKRIQHKLGTYAECVDLILAPSAFAKQKLVENNWPSAKIKGKRKKWGWLARQALRLGEWASAKLPNRTAVVSKTLRSYYGSRYSNPTAFVPNGTELRLRRSGSHLADLGLTPDGYVLFLGRFSPEKNCHPLIAAFQQTTTAFKLVLAGGRVATQIITLLAFANIKASGSRGSTGFPVMHSMKC